MLRILGAFLSLVLLVVVFAAFGLLTDREVFWPPRVAFLDLETVVTQSVIISVGAIGMTVVIVSAGIDLSVGSVAALAMVVSAIAFNWTHSSIATVLAGLATGALCGLANGAIITAFRIVPFIATLGMMGLARGAAKRFAGNSMVDTDAAWGTTPLAGIMNIPRSFEWPFFSPGVWILAALAVAMALVLRGTVFGRYVFAIGSNQATARLCGIRVRTMKVLIYVLGGAFAGLAGVFSLVRQSQGDPTAAMGLELDVIAAVVIGGASLQGGEGTILGSLIGALIMGVLRHGLIKLDVSNPVQEMLIGLIIIAAVVVDQLRQRRGD